MTASAPSPELGLVDGLVLLSELVQKVFVRSAGAVGIPPLQARLLGILRGRRPTMAELARLIDLDKSSTTGLVDRAQRAGLVIRSKVPEDGRSYRVELTDAGARTARAFVSAVTAELEQLTHELRPDERHGFATLVARTVTTSASITGLDLNAGLRRRQGP